MTPNYNAGQRKVTVIRDRLWKRMKEKKKENLRLTWMNIEIGKERWITVSEPI